MRRLKHHDRSCTIHIHSGDRHCSCGLEEDKKTLENLLAVVGAGRKVWDAFDRRGRMYEALLELKKCLDAVNV